MKLVSYTLCAMKKSISKKMQKKLSFLLQKRNSYSTNMTFDMFLVDLGIKKQEYIMLL